MTRTISLEKLGPHLYADGHWDVAKKNIEAYEITPAIEHFMLHEKHEWDAADPNDFRNIVPFARNSWFEWDALASRKGRLDDGRLVDVEIDLSIKRLGVSVLAEPVLDKAGLQALLAFAKETFGYEVEPFDRRPSHMLIWSLFALGQDIPQGPLQGVPLFEQSVVVVDFVGNGLAVPGYRRAFVEKDQAAASVAAATFLLGPIYVIDRLRRRLMKGQEVDGYSFPARFVELREKRTPK